ncbi:MAG: ABC transporter permease [Candidatus Lokiarchaeota archaeon]|nr:ABC transporter permease [Candidatus Harpocratesius repetitus]
MPPELQISDSTRRKLKKRSQNLPQYMNFRKQIKELKEHYIPFLFLPTAKDPILTKRKEELERFHSKRKFIKRLQNPLTMFGIFIIFVIFSWAVFAPLIISQGFYEVTVADFSTLPNLPPTKDHIFGTTRLGMDVFARLVWGARPSLFYGSFIAFLSAFIGVFFGLLAGYHSGIVDNIIMRLVDIMMAFPSLILIVLIAVWSGGNEFIILISYGVLGFAGYTRMLRALVLSERNKTYVQAAKVAGASNLRILYKHILPNCLAPIIVSLSFSIGGVILGLAGLSFLGYGFENSADWGTDLNTAHTKIFSAPWAAIVPGFGVFIAVMGFMLVGDGLRDAMDPRLHNKN